MDWLSCEQGRIWRCSCSWLEPHLLFSDLHSSGWQARAQHSGVMPATARAELQLGSLGAVCAAHLCVCWVVEGHSWLHSPQPEGKLANLSLEAVQTYSHNTRHPCSPTWVAARCSGSELIPLCHVTAGEEAPRVNCREFPKSERVSASEELLVLLWDGEN